MTTQSNIETRDHDYVWELLPWYVNESLSPDETHEVEAHMENCPVCQSEVARCKDLSLSVKANPQKTRTPSAPHFAKVLANVDAYENRQMKSQGSPGWFAKWLPWLGATPRPARFTLAFQGALVVALATTLLVRSFVPTQGYQTLSNPAEPSVTRAQQVRLVFAEDITEKELRGLLLEIPARFIAGPTALGVYTVAVDASTSNARPIQHALAQLRAHPKVRLAEMAGVTSE